MANYTTIKNSLKKLENKLGEANKFQHCWVILKVDFEKIVFPAGQGGSRQNVGYLVVPGKLTEEQWEQKYGVAQ